MATKARITLALTFAVSFFSVGLPYWQIPYAKVSLPSSIFGFGLLAVAVLAAVPRVTSAARLWPSTLIVGASVPAAVLARVVYDTLADSTSHNLWPFEIILSAGPGFLAAFFGAAAGGLLATRSGA
jgi:hypothetical protein